MKPTIIATMAEATRQKTANVISACRLTVCFGVFISMQHLAQVGQASSSTISGMYGTLKAGVCDRVKELCDRPVRNFPPATSHQAPRDRKLPTADNLSESGDPQKYFFSHQRALCRNFLFHKTE